MKKLNFLIVLVSYVILFMSILDYRAGNILEAVYPLMFMGTAALINLAYRTKEWSIAIYRQATQSISTALRIIKEWVQYA